MGTHWALVGNTILKTYLEEVPDKTGPNLDKKCIQLLVAAPSHEILRKFYFFVKPL